MSKLTFNVGNVGSFNVIAICARDFAEIFANYLLRAS